MSWLTWEERVIAKLESIERMTNTVIAQRDALQAELTAERTRRMAAEKVVDALADAITWASGSADFNEGGKAREGWLKMGRTAIDTWFEYRTQYPRVGEENDNEPR